MNNDLLSVIVDELKSINKKLDILECLTDKSESTPSNEFTKTDQKIPFNPFLDIDCD